MKAIDPTTEIMFGDYGGAECFFADVDGDGALEVITYQGPGVFGATPYCDMPHIRELLPASVSVSVFRADGTRLWTWGEPNDPDLPYISHSYESCVAVADIDGDGHAEIVVADGDRAVVLDGRTGAERGTAHLPADCYYIVQATGHASSKHEAAIVVKNGEAGIDPWHYGEPVLGIGPDLQVAWGPVAVPGGGHHILAMDVNGDGKDEFLIGYCAVALDGRILWTLDAIDARKLDADLQHVDYVDIQDTQDGRTLLAVAGSDALYLADTAGHALYTVRQGHCQGAAVGAFIPERGYQAALYNSPDGPLTLFDMSGQPLWAVPTERAWPMGIPSGCEGRRFHCNRPIVKIDGDMPWIGYADGGWPWIVDGQGQRSVELAMPPRARQPAVPSTVADSVRGSDIGYGYAMQAHDTDGDGQVEAIVYDRRGLWVYPMV
jgi:hypothetical protein